MSLQTCELKINSGMNANSGGVFRACHKVTIEDHEPNVSSIPKTKIDNSFSKVLPQPDQSKDS
jgi:hypothetical protein